MRYQPVLGGDRQLFMADRRSGLSYASGGYLLVGDKKDGNDTDVRYCTWTDISVRTVVERLRCGRDCGRGYSRMEFRRLPGEHDRLSGAGNPGDTGSVYVGIFGKIFPEDNASGGFDDSRSVLQSASGGNSSAFYSRAGGLENRFCDFFRSVCRDYGFV